YSSRSVPGIQVKFPKPVKAPACHGAQIQSRRSRPPHPMRAQCDLMIKINIGILVAFMAGKARAHERLGEFRDVRYVDWLLVEKSSFAALSGKKLVARGIVADACDHLSPMFERH